MPLDPIELKALAIELAAAMPPVEGSIQGKQERTPMTAPAKIPDEDVRAVAFSAFAKIDAALVTFRRACENMGNTDEAREMYLVQLALESAWEDLRGM